MPFNCKSSITSESKETQDSSRSIPLSFVPTKPARNQAASGYSSTRLISRTFTSLPRLSRRQIARCSSKIGFHFARSSTISTLVRAALRPRDQRYTDLPTSSNTFAAPTAPNSIGMLICPRQATFEPIGTAPSATRKWRGHGLPPQNCRCNMRPSEHFYSVPNSFVQLRSPLTPTPPRVTMPHRGRQHPSWVATRPQKRGGSYG